MESVTQTTGHQPVMVIVQAPKQREDEEHYEKSYPKKTIFGLSGFLVVAGILSTFIQVLLLFQVEDLLLDLI